MIDQTTADKILTDMFESGWFHQDQIDYFGKEIINSLVSEPVELHELTKHDGSSTKIVEVSEPVEDELPALKSDGSGWRRA